MEFVQLGDRELQELADLLRWYRRNGLWSPAGMTGADDKRGGGLVVKNTETHTIPPYGCMEVTGTSNEANGPNYINVKRPTSSGTLFLFNDHYEIEGNGFGLAQSGPVYRVYKDTGTVTLGDRWGPTANQYYLTKGSGSYVVYGEDDIAANVFRVISEPNSLRMYAARMTTNWSGSTPNATATADIYDVSNTGSPLFSSQTIRDPLAVFGSLTSGDGLYVIFQDGKYYAIQAPCPS